LRKGKGTSFNLFDRSKASSRLENAAKTVAPLPLIRTKGAPRPLRTAMALGMDGIKRNAGISRSFRSNAAASRILFLSRKERRILAIRLSFVKERGRLFQESVW
jgi:hypothetical protein